MGSSSSSSIPISLSRAPEWHMLIRPFREIANRLAYLLSSLRLPNPLRLNNLWAALLPGRGYYRHYRSLKEEQWWWDESARIRTFFFAPSDARHGEIKISDPRCCLTSSSIPLVTSYVPRLLPRYRDHPCLDDAANDYELMPSTYRKWHRLVFPHKCQPSRREAEKKIRYISTRDRKEIARIARLVSDEAVAQKDFSPSPVYRNLWESWLQHKGPDLTIVFE